MSYNCIFCAIISKSIPAQIIDQNEHCIVIQDIAPKAPVHYLIIPKKHITNLYAITLDDGIILQAVLFMAQQVANSLQLEQGFTLLANNGAGAGQTVFHMHYHLISGKVLFS